MADYFVHHINTLNGQKLKVHTRYEDEILKVTDFQFRRIVQTEESMMEVVKALREQCRIEASTLWRSEAELFNPKTDEEVEREEDAIADAEAIAMMNPRSKEDLLEEAEIAADEGFLGVASFLRECAAKR